MRLTLTIPLVLLALTLCQAAAAEAGGNRAIVILKPDASVDAVLASTARGTSVADVYRGAVNGFAARLSPRTRAALARDPRVLFISADRPLRATAQRTPTGVARIGAAKPVTLPGTSTGGAGVGVAVIDTGIDLTHPDLTGVQSAANCVDHAKPASDDNGHGTHVAGTIAARDNDIGVIGVAPAANLWAIKSLDSAGAGSWSTVICGIVWATNHPALVRVVNMSLEGSGTATPSNPDCTNGNSDALHYAICRATRVGITLVASAGNSSIDAAGTLPAAYDEVIAVSALSDSDGRPGRLGRPPSCLSGQRDDYFATFSNFGRVIDIAAPGVCILSTYKSGGYATLSGTSMAAPHVSGAAALYIQTHPAATWAEVRAALIATAEPGPIPGDPDAYPEGVVHVQNGAAATAGTTQAPALPDAPAPLSAAVPSLLPAPASVPALLPRPA
jgi:subtilisin family serine protease